MRHRFTWRAGSGQQVDCQCRIPFPLHSQCLHRLRASALIRQGHRGVRRNWRPLEIGRRQILERLLLDGGILYKHRLRRYKNGMLRFRFGPQFGAVERKFYFGLEVGFEYNYVFQNGCEFSIIQKNNVNFLHGDTFRNGLMIGFKIPF